MNYAESIPTLAGGLGLFLIGIGMMSDGLKLAAGDALRIILARGTRTRIRALASGLLVTGLVQSSSAVTVATIGFTNAGLLSLPQAAWVVFGSNIGSTMTGWMVALIGFKLQMEALALPLIGLAVVLRLTGPDTRRGAFGHAFAGFGLLFLGIGFLKEAFDGIGAGIELPEMVDEGLLGALIYVGIGLLLTTVMQSSAAALVIVLSASAGGLVTLPHAAAAVIGANLGTTTTAVLAVIGATSAAKRVAAAHVIFNVITGTVALLMLTPMLALVLWLEDAFDLTPQTATTLAVFHTSFNVLGVLLMVPLAGFILALLARRFRSAEEDQSRPRYLDTTVLAVPALAVEAVNRELVRLGAIALRAARAAVSAERAPATQLLADQAQAGSLAGAIGSFIAELGRHGLSERIASALPDALRAAQFYTAVTDLAVEVAQGQSASAPLDDERLAPLLAEFKRQAVEVLDLADVGSAEFALERGEHALAPLEDLYGAVNTALLRAGAEGRIPVRRMSAEIDTVRHIRRTARRAMKAAKRVAHLREVMGMAAVMSDIPGQPAGGGTPGDGAPASAAAATPAAVVMSGHATGRAGDASEDLVPPAQPAGDTGAAPSGEIPSPTRR